MMQSITLSELGTHIQDAIKLKFDTPVWIRAEISELRENHNGHCYIEFIEKDSQTNTVIARIKAIIWLSTYRMLKPYFELETGQNLSRGLNVLVAVSVEYNGQYGLSLNIRDIDPTYTIGELAAQRQRIIRQLEADGVMEMNRQLKLNTEPQRLAIISSGTAAGYDDFQHQLQSNSSGFVFYTHLFQSVMQGEQAALSITSALDRIYAHVHLFDAVVIIRGGGSVTDLACFDNYELALHCAQFPIPILTGIGHHRDTSVLDLVAYNSLKTPTAVASFVIEQLSASEAKVTAVFDAISGYVHRHLAHSKQHLVQAEWDIKTVLQHKLNAKKMHYEKQKSLLIHVAKHQMTRAKHTLELLEKNIEVQSPSYFLNHGYTITTYNGKRIRSASELQPGYKIRTWFADAQVESIIEKLN